MGKVKNNTPAVLFYAQDFLTGTSDMTMEERGYYITLLSYQNVHGHMSEEYIRRIAPDCPEYVLEKFIRDNNGDFYNERMENEIEKRNNFSESRSKNRKKTDESIENADSLEVNNTSITSEKDMKNTSFSYEKHMETETETEIYINNKSKNNINLQDSVIKTKKEKDSNSINKGELENTVKDCVDAFNAVCVSLPKVQKISPERKKKVKERLKSFTPAEIRIAFENVENSDFASGRDGKWRCSFDWLFKSDSNMTKALEDNYKNNRRMTDEEKAFRELEAEVFSGKGG